MLLERAEGVLGTGRARAGHPRRGRTSARCDGREALARLPIASAARKVVSDERERARARSPRASRSDRAATHAGAPLRSAAGSRRPRSRASAAGRRSRGGRATRVVGMRANRVLSRASSVPPAAAIPVSARSARARRRRTAVVAAEPPPSPSTPPRSEPTASAEATSGDDGELCPQAHADPSECSRRGAGPFGPTPRARSYFCWPFVLSKPLSGRPTYGKASSSFDVVAR